MTPILHAVDVSKKFACSSHICPCDTYHTCEVERYGIVRMGSGEVHLQVKLCREGSFHQAGFGPMLFQLRRCAHDVDLHFKLRISDNQWQHVASRHDRFVLFQAKLKGRLLDCTTDGSGIISSPDLREASTNENVHSSAELFAGGFSGWAHAGRRLCEMGLLLEHRLAVDLEKECCEAYMKSHDFKHVCHQDRLEWKEDELPHHLFVQADVRNGAWYHLMGDYVLDMLMMSPPCPAWSFATSALGLMKEEGRLTLDAIGLCNLVKPRVILFENVAGMRNHEHWTIIRFARCLNLSEVAPQNRDRLMLVATLDEANLLPHLCTGWPSFARPNMKTFDCILDLSVQDRW